MALRSSNCAALTRPTLSKCPEKAHQTLVPRMTMPTTINLTPSQWRRATGLGMPDAPAREGNPDEIQTQHRIGDADRNRLQDAQPQQHAAAQT